MSVMKKIKKILKKFVKISHKADYDIHAPQGQLDYGIVFCGGGAKGAFQLGVWKKLEELGVAERFTGISGASVGALNALLFAQGDYQKAQEAWMKMEEGDLGPSDLNELLTTSPKIVIDSLKHWDKNHGLANKKKLKKIVKKNITSESLNDKMIYVSLSALKVRKIKLRKKNLVLKLKYTYLNPNDSIKKNIKKVLASAAYPVAFSPVKIGKKKYIDGGATDNEPISPLIKAGYRNILVVHLNKRGKNGKDRLETFTKRLRKNFSKEDLEGVTICHVWPQHSLGNLLEIDPKLTAKRIKKGYEAASAQLTAHFFQ